MIRERIGATVMNAYPKATRIERGDEMLGTLLDAGEVSVAAFARESVSLGFGGMRERAAARKECTVRGLAVDVLRWAAVLWIVLNLAGMSGYALPYPSGVRGVTLWLFFLWPVLAASLLGYDRFAGVCGIAWCVMLQTRFAMGPYATFFAGSLVPLASFIAMVAAPRHRKRDPRQLAWLIPAIAISFIHGPGFGLLQFGFCPLTLPILVAVSLAGIVILPADPRMAVAASLVWASAGLMSAEEAFRNGPVNASLLFLACAPITILVTIFQHRVIDHQK